MYQTIQPDNLDLRNYTILVIDDNPTNLSVAVDYLEECGLTILVSQNGESGISRAIYAHPDIILLDVLMPGMGGFETCRLLKQNRSTRDIPVIFMTALSDTENKVQGFAAGAVDYVTKPIQGEEVLARVTVHLQLQALTQKLAQQTAQLEQQNTTLEQRVAERTAELAQSLESLQRAKAQLERSFEEVLQAKAVAESASRARSQFFARMSHELRTPLNAILGFSELLQLQLLDNNVPAPWVQNSQFIHQAGQELLALVDDVLELSGVELSHLQVDRTNFDGVQLAQELLAEFASLALARNNGLRLELDPLLCPEDSTARLLWSDRFKVHRILANVLDNACKFTENGQIILSVSPCQTLQPNLMVFQIQDTGIGITSDHLERIFEPFAQVDESNSRQYHGAGLGLAVARKFCQLLGGTIAVTSTIDQGSTFTIQLPIVPPDLSPNLGFKACFLADFRDQAVGYTAM